MSKFKSGDWVTHESITETMIVRLERGQDEEGNICCEWQENESGEMLYNFFNPNELTPAN